MKKIPIGAMVLGLGLAACQPKAPSQDSTPQVVNATTEKTSTSSTPATTPEKVQARDFEAFRADFPKEFPPYEINSGDKATGKALSTEDQLAYLQRSVEAQVVVEILFEDDTYIHLVTAEKPLEDVYVYAWNIFDQAGELLSHRVVAGTEGEDLINGDFREDGTVAVDLMYPSGKDELGEQLYGRRESLYRADDGMIVEVK